MKLNRANTYNKTTVHIDGEAFIDCNFIDCKLIYAGGAMPVLGNNKFSNCTWEFDDAAARTLAFLHGLYSGGGEAVVESVFKMTKDGTILGNGRKESI